MNWTVPFNTFSYESCFSIQETFNKQQEVCVHRVTAAQAHRYSTMGACFSACLIGGVNVGQGSCSGRPSTLKYHRDWGSNRLFSGHTTLFNQDNSTVGRLTPADVDKAGNAKRKDMKQHKQVVSTPTPLFIYFISVWIILINASASAMQHSILSVLQDEFLYFSSVKVPERGRCPSHG